MNKDFLDYFSIFTTTIGTLLGFLGIYLTLNSNCDLPNIITQINQFSFILSIVLFWLLLLCFKKLLFNLRYSKGYNTISKGFEFSHSLRDNDKIKELPYCVNSMQDFCSKIAEAFSIFTNRQTYVCIKLFHISEKGDIYLQTFCRDSKSRDNENRINPEDENEDELHYLSANTDFKHIFTNVNKEGAEYRYHFSNNLPGEDFYENSRIDPNVYPPKTKLFIWKNIKRQLAWNLPYRSSITVPITRFSDKKLTEDKIVGFLCVDSPFIWTFTETLDINIFRGIAAGIYPTVKKICDIHFQGVYNSTKQNKSNNKK